MRWWRREAESWQGDHRTVLAPTPTGSCPPRQAALKYKNYTLTKVVLSIHFKLSYRLQRVNNFYIFKHVWGHIWSFFPIRVRDNACRINNEIALWANQSHCPKILSDLHVFFQRYQYFNFLLAVLYFISDTITPVVGSCFVPRESTWD